MKTKLVIKLILVFSFFLGFTLQIPNVQATQYIKPQEFKIYLLQLKIADITLRSLTVSNDR